MHLVVAEVHSKLVVVHSNRAEARSIQAVVHSIAVAEVDSILADLAAATVLVVAVAIDLVDLDRKQGLVLAVAE